MTPHPHTLGMSHEIAAALRLLRENGWPDGAAVERALNDPTATHDRVRFRERAAATLEAQMVASILRAALTED